MEPIKTKIEKTLKLKKFKDFNLSFLAGDASDRKYFELFYGKNKEVVMYDMDKSNLKVLLKSRIFSKMMFLFHQLLKIMKKRIY